MDKKGNKIATQKECGSSHETPAPFPCKASPGSVFESFGNSCVEGDISQHSTQLQAAATLSPSQVWSGKRLN